MAAIEESFQEFFTNWKENQNNQLNQLITTSKTSKPPQKISSMADFVRHVIAHYEDYYRVKSESAQSSPFMILTPTWKTQLEDAFLWIGGWRPSMAFRLLYSVTGLQLEYKLTELLNGQEMGDLGDFLSAGQLESMDNLQRSTINEERKITENMAKQQEKVADVEMVDISHKVSEEVRKGEGTSPDGLSIDQVDMTLKPTEEGMGRILQNADSLRLRTLKGVVDILSPIQAVHFLIAAAELHQRVHDCGKEREEKQLATSNYTV